MNSVRHIGLSTLCLGSALAMTATASAQELVPVSRGLDTVRSAGSATAEELAESGKGKKAKAVKKVVKKVAKAANPLRRVTDTLDNYAKAGWEAGRLMSKHDPGPYPGFKAAVLPSLKKPGR